MADRKVTLTISPNVLPPAGLDKLGADIKSKIGDKVGASLGESASQFQYLKDTAAKLRAANAPAAGFDKDTAAKLRAANAPAAGFGGEKAAATPEQVAAIRSLAAKHAKSGGALAELIPEALPAKGPTKLSPRPASAGGSGIGGALKGMAQSLAGGSGIGGALKGMAQNLLPGIMGGMAGGGLGAIAGLAGGPAGAAVVVAAGAVKQIFDEIVGLPGRFMEVAAKISAYVEAANPMAVERFNYAVKDTTAVFGEALTPALEAMKDVVRATGDALVSSDLIPSLQSLGEELGAAFQDNKETFIFGIRVGAEFVATLVRITEALVWSTKKLWTIFTLDFESFVKDSNFNQNVEGSSFGLGARGSRFHGGEAFGKAAATATLSSGYNPVVQAAKNSGTMVELLQNLVTTTTENWATFLARKVTEYAQNQRKP